MRAQRPLHTAQNNMAADACCGPATMIVVMSSETGIFFSTRQWTNMLMFFVRGSWWSGHDPPLLPNSNWSGANWKWWVAIYRHKYINSLERTMVHSKEVKCTDQGNFTPMRAGHHRILSLVSMVLHYHSVPFSPRAAHHKSRICSRVMLRCNR